MLIVKSYLDITDGNRAAFCQAVLIQSGFFRHYYIKNTANTAAN